MENVTSTHACIDQLWQYYIRKSLIDLNSWLLISTFWRLLSLDLVEHHLRVLEGAHRKFLLETRALREMVHMPRTKRVDEFDWYINKIEPTVGWLKSNLIRSDQIFSQNVIMIYYSLFWHENSSDKIHCNCNETRVGGWSIQYRYEKGIRDQSGSILILPPHLCYSASYDRQLGPTTHGASQLDYLAWTVSPLTSAFFPRTVSPFQESQVEFCIKPNE